MASILARIRRVPPSPFAKRTLIAILVLAIVMTVGTVGMMLFEGWSLVDSFYFMALIATAEGPAATPATDTGKIFAAIMAFVSIGAAISAITFTFGPLFGIAIKQGFMHVEREEEKLKEKLLHKNGQGSNGSQVEE